MATFKVQIDPNSVGLTLKNGHNLMLVSADDDDDALVLALAHNEGPDEAAWANATVSEVVGVDLSPVTNPDDLRVLSYVLDIAIAGADTNASFSYTAEAGDTYADVFAAMKILLNAHPDIAGADFAADLLTISDIGDDIGDHTVTATFKYGDSDIASFLGAVTHEGIAAAVLTIATSTGVVAPTIELLRA